MPSDGASLASIQELEFPLAFVNRYAEALDVLVPNLHNAAAIRKGANVKFKTPLAAQPPGTGKTELGCNLTAILRRPRDPPDVEVVLAERLRRAWCWRGNAGPVERALRDGRNENLVVRSLLAAFPDEEELIMQLKDTKPLVIRMNELVTPRFGLDFDAALAYAIFCNARGLDGREPATRQAFLGQDPTLQSASGAVKAFMRERKGAPVLLVLDDITDLGHPNYDAYFISIQRNTALHRAMSGLSLHLQLLHSVRGCFVYCTGRSLWLSTLALVGAGSPLFVTPTMLLPLSSSDVQDSLRSTRLPDGRALVDAVGVRADQVPHLARTAAKLTGGVGRPLQYLLRARQRVAQGVNAPLLASAEEVDDALVNLMPDLAELPGLQLRVQWDGPAASVGTGDLPAWTAQKAQQMRLVQLFAQLLLLDVPFRPAETVTLGTGDPARVVDVAVALGMNYAPEPDGSRVRLVAGDWLCRSLASDPIVAAEPSALVSARMLGAMRTFGGTMRGRPFELLCADALCFRHMALRGKIQKDTSERAAQQGEQAPQPAAVVRLRDLLPHCSGSQLGADVLPQLQLVVVPKASRQVGRRLTDAKKAELLASRTRWTGEKVIHVADLPWLLWEWLPVGSVAVPGDAQSGSQDVFLRLPSGVVGFSLKAVSEPGTAWGDLREELAKAPPLPAGTPYTLVLWSLNLAPQLRDALAGAPHAVFGAGVWQLVDSKLTRFDEATAGGGAADAAAVFVVPAGTELVIANPHAVGGGGLAELLGPRLLSELRDAGGSQVDVRLLQQWTAAP